MVQTVRCSRQGPARASPGPAPRCKLRVLNWSTWQGKARVGWGRGVVAGPGVDTLALTRTHTRAHVPIQARCSTASLWPWQANALPIPILSNACIFLAPFFLETQAWLEENFLEIHLDNSYSPFSDQSKWHFLQKALSKSPDLDPSPSAGFKPPLHNSHVAVISALIGCLRAAPSVRSKNVVVLLTTCMCLVPSSFSINGCVGWVLMDWPGLWMVLKLLW